MATFPKDVTTLGQMIEHRALTMADKPVLYFRDETVTFAQLNAEANKYANVLSDFGVVPGDRVCLFIPNRLEFLYAYFGLIKLGAMMISLSVMLKADEAKYIIDDAKAKMLITTEYLFPTIEPVRDRLDSIEHILYLDENPPEGVTELLPLAEEASDKFTSPEIDPDSVACIIYTSGTTGKPTSSRANMCAFCDLWRRAERAHGVLRASNGSGEHCKVQLQHFFGRAHNVRPADERS
jgi:acyl-coenzyme A synthetase/AMP-(fatty) acid ligase